MQQVAASVVIRISEQNQRKEKDDLFGAFFQAFYIFCHTL